jgi:hypothetical protein
MVSIFICKDVTLVLSLASILVGEVRLKSNFAIIEQLCPWYNLSCRGGTMLLEVNDAQYTNVHKLVQTLLNVSLYELWISFVPCQLEISSCMTEVSSLSVTLALDSHHMKGLDLLLEDQQKCPMTQREVQRSISKRGHGW